MSTFRKLYNWRQEPRMDNVCMILPKSSSRFNFTIENWSNAMALYETGRCIQSAVFTIPNDESTTSRFCLQIFPNGFNDACKDFISARLVNITRQEKKATVSLSILKYDETTNTMKGERIATYSNEHDELKLFQATGTSNSSWDIPQLISHAQICPDIKSSKDDTSKSDFVMMNNLNFLVDITVYGDTISASAMDTATARGQTIDIDKIAEGRPRDRGSPEPLQDQPEDSKELIEPSQAPSAQTTGDKDTTQAGAVAYTTQPWPLQPRTASGISPSPQQGRLHHNRGDSVMYHSAICLGNSPMPASEDYHPTLQDGVMTLYNNPLHSDVLLCCGDVTIHAHKVILALRSPTFREKFQQLQFQVVTALNGGKYNMSKITDPVVFHELIRFIYTDACSTEILDQPYIARALFKAALRYQLPGLCALCEDHIVDCLTPETLLDTLTFASNVDSARMRLRCIQFGRANAEIIINIPVLFDSLDDDVKDIVLDAAPSALQRQMRAAQAPNLIVDNTLQANAGAGDFDAEDSKLAFEEAFEGPSVLKARKVLAFEDQSHRQEAIDRTEGNLSSMPAPQ